MGKKIKKVPRGGQSKRLMMRIWGGKIPKVWKRNTKISEFKN